MKMLPSLSPSDSAFDKDTKLLNGDTYDSLSTSDDDITLLDGQIKLRRKRSSWCKIITTLCVIYIASSLAGLIALSYKLEKVTDDHRVVTDDHKAVSHDHAAMLKPAHVGSELGDCGTSIETARAAGCIFDPMSWLWIAPACYNPHTSLVQAWKDSTDWHFYTNVNLTPESEISRESAYRGDYAKLYTGFKYHKIHCSFSWRRQHAITSQRLPMDDNVLNQRHMNHCQMVLLNEFFHQDVNCTEGVDAVCPIQLIPEFTKCGRYF